MTTSPPTGLIWTDRFLDHQTGAHHPERPARLEAIRERLTHTGLMGRMAVIEPDPAPAEMVEKVHSPDYIGRFRQRCAGRAPFIDSQECPLSPGTHEAAWLAAGAPVAAADAVMAGRIRNAFCPVRPPGHHAERAAALGFCYFNNIAVAAEHLRHRHGLQRVAILDWDVHHGNGTQHHFEEDPHVLFVSIHQHPRTLFPGTGFEDETGRGPGAGTVLNCPMMPGAGDEQYIRAFEQQILPAIRNFAPQFLLISAGFDAHMDDPLANIRLTTGAFEWMTRHARLLAGEVCGGRMVTVLEGGYNLDALADCVQAHVESLMAGTE